MVLNYTNNVPQSNQRIADTQPLIQANFGFLEDAINQEHNFDATDATKTYHLQASMPNLAGGDPVALPSGTNGLYYVLGGIPKFYNALVKFLKYSSCLSFTQSGSITLNGSPQTMYTIPANSCGVFFVQSSNVATYAMGSYISSGTNIGIHTTSSSTILVTNSGLNLIGATTGSSVPVKWTVEVSTP